MVETCNNVAKFVFIYAVKNKIGLNGLQYLPCENLNNITAIATCENIPIGMICLLSQTNWSLNYTSSLFQEILLIKNLYLRSLINIVFATKVKPQN